MKLIDYFGCSKPQSDRFDSSRHSEMEVFYLIFRKHNFEDMKKTWQQKVRLLTDPQYLFQMYFPLIYFTSFWKWQNISILDFNCFRYAVSLGI